MSLTMYQVSIPVFDRALHNLSYVLECGARWAGDKGVADQVLLTTRLTPDMLPLVKQVQIASDMVKFAVARLSGSEAPAFADDEASFADLQQRIQKTRDYLASFKPEQLNDSAERQVQVKSRAGIIEFSGQDYLLQFVIPNLLFHCTTAYDILRQSGVSLGKQDFLYGANKPQASAAA